VSTVVVPESIDSGTKFNFGQNEFQIAFAVENYLTRRGTDDPDYVEWYVRLYRSIDGVESHTDLNYHKCGQEDYDLFWPN